MSGNAENFVELLGEKLQGKDGEVSTREALAGKEAVMLYFSAHWCPPCRGFTPKFAEWYSKDLKAKGSEVIFVSSDRDEDSFKDYYKEMPWLALTYSERDLKEKLSKKYKVQGIPTVVILDGSANVITKDGRAAISGDPTGADFPWKPKTLPEIMAGLKLVGKDGSACGPEAVKDKVFAFYFSAHWCPPCRGFTPKLAEWYSKDLKAKGLEVIFVSSDRDEDSFKGYYKEMPWLALDYSQRKEKELLSNHFGVEGIPSLVILDKDGSVINKEGRNAISGDPTGADFPWHPKPVGTVENDVSVVNEVPTVIAFCEGDAGARQAAEAAMTPLALRFKEAARAADEDPEFAFLVATESGGLASRIRSMMALPLPPPAKHEHPVEKAPNADGWGCDGCSQGKTSADERFRCAEGCDVDFCAECHARAGGVAEAAPPKLMLLDIPDDGGFYEGPEGPVTAEAVEKLLADYKAKAIARKQLEQ
jgi:nucleoredoxin